MKNESFDVFSIHEKVIEDYKSFVSSFINIKDDKIKKNVEEEIEKGRFWPEPLIRFNPSFEQGESLQSLCNKDILHPEIENIFTAGVDFKQLPTLGKLGVDDRIRSGGGRDLIFRWVGAGPGKALFAVPMQVHVEMPLLVQGLVG